MLANWKMTRPCLYLRLVTCPVFDLNILCAKAEIDSKKNNGTLTAAGMDPSRVNLILVK